MTLRAWFHGLSSQSERLTDYYGSTRFRALMLTMLGVVLVIVLGLTWITLQHNKEKIVANAESSLMTVLQATAGRLEIWVNERLGAAVQFGHDPELGFIATRLRGISARKQDLLESGSVAFARKFLEKNRNRIPGSEEFFILNPDYINIVAPRDSDVGAPNLIAAHDGESLRQVFKGQGAFVLPFRSGIDTWRSADGRVPQIRNAMYVVAPIVTYGEVIAAIAIAMDPAKGFTQVMQVSRTGEFGETYAFNRRGRLLSKSRFEAELRRIGLIEAGQGSILNIEIRDPGVNLVIGEQPGAATSERPLTLMAASALRAASAPGKAAPRGGVGTIFRNVEGYRDYRGVPVMGAWLWLYPLDLGLAVEMGMQEALSGYFTLRWTVASVLGVTLLLTIGATLFTLFLGQRAAQISNEARDELEQRVIERTAELDVSLKTQEDQNTLLLEQNEKLARIQGELQTAYDLIKVHKDRMESELNVGRDIQMSMIPLNFPAFPDRDEFSVFAVLEPAREVGGDFYDFFFIDEENFCICIGDVSGKGVPSALFMAVAKTLIKSRAADDLSTANIVTHVNDRIRVDNLENMFVTLFIGIINIKTGDIVFTNAGHNPPYVRREDGSLRRLDERHGPVVGITEGKVYREDKSRLAPADMLFLYTDGVTEAMNAQDVLFADNRLVEVLETLDADTVDSVVRKTVAAVKNFEGGTVQTDDMTVLAFQFHGKPAPSTKAETEIVIRNEYSAISIVNKALDAFADEHGIPESVTLKLKVVFDEVLSNVISYAYPDTENHEITARIECAKNRVSVTITDDGIPFNPLDFSPPNLEPALEDRKIGGLGIHIVRNLMDNVAYRRQIDSNVLTLVKEFDAADM